MIYLDHAATSWPKPAEVTRAMVDFLEQSGGNPGRSGHSLSVAAARIVYAAREAVAGLFHAPDPLRVIFTANVTHSLNLAISGLLTPGDRVVTTGMEHNSVMRPLRALESTGVAVEVVPCGASGQLDLDRMRQALRRRTRLVVATHASNVTGTLMPLAEIAELAHAAGALLLVDAAQTAGAIAIDQPALGIDLLAFTGHKSLQGPPGTGGLVIGANVDVAWMRPLMRGGTGSRSEYEQQPEMLPDKYESGTPNGAGIAGLGAGVGWVLARGIDCIRAHEVSLTAQLVAGLRAIPGVTVHTPASAREMMAVVSCTVAGKDVSEVGLRLDEEFGILARVGLHCAPAAHRTIGTFPEGTVRLAPGPLTTPDEIAATLRAMEAIARS